MVEHLGIGVGHLRQDDITKPLGGPFKLKHAIDTALSVDVRMRDQCQIYGTQLLEEYEVTYATTVHLLQQVVEGYYHAAHATRVECDHSFANPAAVDASFMILPNGMPIYSLSVKETMSIYQVRIILQLYHIFVYC